MSLRRLAKHQYRLHHLADLVLAIMVLDIDIHDAGGNFPHGERDGFYWPDQRFGEAHRDEGADYHANQAVKREPKLVNSDVYQNI
jgi:hypothetical protein